MKTINFILQDLHVSTTDFASIFLDRLFATVAKDSVDRVVKQT